MHVLSFWKTAPFSLQWAPDQPSEPERYRLRLRSRPPPRPRDEFLGLIGRLTRKRSCRLFIQGFPGLHGRPFVLGFRFLQEQIQFGPNERSAAIG